MTFEELQPLMAGVFGVDLERITPDLALGAIPQWDSINHLNLMLALERERGIEVTEEAIVSCVSVAGLLEFLG